MSLKYNSNNSVKSFINLLFNKLPSKDIDNNELNELWNTCDIEIGEESELSNWQYTLDEINNRIIFKNYNKTIANKITIYGAYKIGDEVYRTKLTKFEDPFKNVQSNLTEVKFEPGIDCSELTSLHSAFYNLQNLTSIEGLENLDTSNVTDMSNTFQFCYSLTSLNLSNWNVSNVKTMFYMFYQCRLLNIIKVSKNKWIVPSECVTNNMFGGGCKISEVTYVD